ncbi:hypothetical protein CAP48_19415 (plasmid) [Advenella sp. S44]|nr:hypothetical protein CAP48_19415 [Advenella sp. S44]
MNPLQRACDQRNNEYFQGIAIPIFWDAKELFSFYETHTSPFVSLGLGESPHAHYVALEKAMRSYNTYLFVVQQMFQP